MTSGEPVRLTRAQVRLIDKLAIERHHIPGIVLMENAARNAAQVASEMLGGPGGEVEIVCGGGNNGGDGLAVARHLHNRGLRVQIHLVTDPAHYRGDALINWEIITAMDLHPREYGVPSISNTRAGLIIDAVFGTGLSKPPRSNFGDVVHEINAAPCNVLALDLPSGLDCDTGEPLGPCIRATRTITFVAEKVGFANPASKQYTGEITVGDIGCPRELIEEVAKMSPR